MRAAACASAMPSSTGAIELDGVGRRYGVGEVTVTALEDVSLRVEPGEFVVVLGPSEAARPRCST